MATQASKMKKGGTKDSKTSMSAAADAVQAEEMAKRHYTVQPKEWTDLDITLTSLFRTLDVKYSDCLYFSIALMHMVFPSKQKDKEDYAMHQAAWISSQPLKTLPTLRKLEVQLASLLLYAMSELKVENPFHKLPSEGAIYKSLVDQMKNPLLLTLIVKNTKVADIKPEEIWRYKLLSSNYTDEQRKYRSFLQDLLKYLNEIEQGRIANAEMKAAWQQDLGRISIAMLEAEILAIYAQVTARLAAGTVHSKYIRDGGLYMKNFPGLVYQYRNLLTPEMSHYLCLNCEEIQESPSQVVKKKYVNYRVEGSKQRNDSDEESDSDSDF